MDELAKAAAEKMGMPESMIMRSARARAKAQGVSVEDVLKAWAGGGEVAAGSGGGTTEPTGASPEPAAPEAPAGPEVEVLEPEAAAVVPDDAEAAAATTETETEAEDVPEPELDAVAAGVLPRWLVALFIVIPAIAIAYALFLPNGPNCGDGGRLAVDVVTGEAVNCDGSDYGVDVIDFFAIGQETYASCQACHGANGEGGSNFPALGGGEVLVTFPEGQCEEQVTWVELGTLGWPDATYGATAKPVGGSGAVMPGFASLTDEALRSVVMFERVAFGGQELEAALEDCGLAVAEAASE